MELDIKDKDAPEAQKESTPKEKTPPRAVTGAAAAVWAVITIAVFYLYSWFDAHVSQYVWWSTPTAFLLVLALIFSLFATALFIGAYTGIIQRLDDTDD